MKRRDSGSRAYASGREGLRRGTSPFKDFQSLRLWFTQVSCTILWTPQIISLPLWGFSRVGICLFHYCLPRQVLENNRCSVKSGGWINHPRSYSLSGSQELWVLDTPSLKTHTPTHPPQLCSLKTQGLWDGQLDLMLGFVVTWLCDLGKCWLCLGS